MIHVIDIDHFLLGAFERPLPEGLPVVLGLFALFDLAI